MSMTCSSDNYYFCLCKIRKENQLYTHEHHTTVEPRQDEHQQTVKICSPYPEFVLTEVIFSPIVNTSVISIVNIFISPGVHYERFYFV